MKWTGRDLWQPPNPLHNFTRSPVLGIQAASSSGQPINWTGGGLASTYFGPTEEPGRAERPNKYNPFFVLQVGALFAAKHYIYIYILFGSRDSKPYSGGPHIRFPFWGEGSLWILGFGVPSRPDPSSEAVKSTLPGSPEESSILNADLARCNRLEHRWLSSLGWGTRKLLPGCKA